MSPSKVHRVPKALVLEDDPVTQQYLTRILSKSGIETTIAENGGVGLYHYIKDPSFDVVILDLLMPRVSGKHFLIVAEELYLSKIIKTRPKIIICTSIEESSELWELSKFRCVHSIKKKPVVASSLLSDISLLVPLKHPTEKASESAAEVTTVIV